ncbi:hypothetical protein [Nocardioides donggukensis]|uniref:Uncharacterized protein n=1 Tax=Nocardioides donggukensis TaxID=2774019 RepID=A0A927Q0T0_9ACTN|nr:hypothetical protein [Nocardioides donggukensis]MBD8868784.1 hypothetical protein [Nocardioides donggukensis]
MSEKRVHEGRVIPPAAKGAISAVDGLAALRQIVSAAHECWVIHEQESTKRARLRTYEQTEVAKIKAAESVLKHYFDQVFTERRAVYEEMFARLDQAMETDQPEMVHSVLRGIVDVAQSSPLANIGDLSQIRAALDDPDHEWEL